MISGGLTAAYNALVPEFERPTGNKVVTAYGPSMGTTVNAIPVRLERGEPADVLILVGYALGDLDQAGQGRRRQPRRSREIADRRRGEGRRAEAGHLLPPMRSSARCWRRNRSPIPTAPAASMSRPKCSRSSALPTR